jgi:hypothetical protein
MNYKIVVQGGVMGIQKSYEGQVPLEGKEKKLLLNVLKKKETPKNPLLRDGLNYSITLEDDDGARFHSEYDSSNVPKEVLRLMEKISGNK